MIPVCSTYKLIQVTEPTFLNVDIQNEYCHLVQLPWKVREFSYNITSLQAIIGNSSFGVTFTESAIHSNEYGTIFFFPFMGVT